MSGTPGGTRTPGPLLRRQLLYPPELQARIKTPPRQGRPQKEAFALERVMGIEPTRPAWKAGILPLNYTRTGLTLNVSLDIIARKGGLCQSFFLKLQTTAEARRKKHSSPRRHSV